MMDSDTPRRRPWVAALLSLLCHGLGFVYAGRPGVGAIVFVLAFGISMASALALGAGLRATVAAGIAATVFWGAQAAMAARAAKTASGQVRWFARPWALAGIFVVTWVVGAAFQAALAPYRAQVFSMPSGSMAPSVLTGDYIVAVPGAPIERGAVVVHAAPGASLRPEPIMKRVVGLPGDVIEVRDGQLVLNGMPVERERIGRTCSYEARSEGRPWREEPCVLFMEELDRHRYGTYCTPNLACGDFERLTVPAGYLFVLGDHRDHSADSRVYGPIPQEAILGRASYVLLSIGPSGIRWGRAGADIP